MIEDWDVASYYPNLAIANNFYPAHLGSKFCSIYKEVYEQRKKYPKKSAENEMLKLALNGVYGDSNNQYSPFYDPQYTMSITINGQLLLCMLCDVLSQCKDIRIIQINTDGITLYYPKYLKEYVHQVMTWWQSMTNLTLENAEYNRVYIRDVNHYLAEYTDGTLKRKVFMNIKKNCTKIIVRLLYRWLLKRILYAVRTFVRSFKIIIIY